MKKEDHNSIELVMTCGACPEQYDALYEDEEVGYLRLRHGRFSVEYKDTVVYEASPKGDGIFDDDEREGFLTEAKKAIYKAMKEDKI